MVRRSTVDRSPQPVAHGAGYAAVTEDLAGGSGRPAPWRGAGGRWLVWVLRTVLWVVVLLVGYRGVAAIISSETGPVSGPAPVSQSRPGFPVTLVSAYALEFGQVYLNATPATAHERAASLATFLPPGTDPEFGWNGQGTLRLESEQVAGVSVRDAHHAVVTLLARVNGRLMELGVPVYAARGGLVVSGEPAWLPGPRRISPPGAGAATTDLATQSVLMSQLPAFFEAYGSGNQVTLARYVVPGVKIAGLAGQVRFGSLTNVAVPAGGRTRHVVATVLWHLTGQAPVPAPAPGTAVPTAPPALQMAYALTVVKRGGTWYVASIQPSDQTAGQP